MVGKIAEAAKRELMGPIQKVGSVVTVRLIVVCGVDDEVLIAVAGCSRRLSATRVFQAGKAIGKLEVDALHVLHQLDLHGIVAGTSDRLEENGSLLGRVDTLESAICSNSLIAGLTKVCI